MSSKFSTPFLKKSPLLGAYENAADGKAFMGGLVTGQEQFAKLQQDIVKGFNNYTQGEGTQLANLEKNIAADDDFMSSGPGKDMSQSGVESRLGLKKEKKKSTKPLNIDTDFDGLIEFDEAQG